ncbi:MAG: hypothetical protein QXJ06_06195 [Candidatus Aenigmatarchaeota archaeon]
MKPAEIIVGVYKGNKDSITQFKKIINYIVGRFNTSIDSFSIEDISQTLIENILADKRGILSKAIKEPDSINNSYFTQWIKWEISDFFRTISTDFQHISIDTNIYEDEESSFTLADTLFYEKADIEDSILAEELCSYLKEFLMSLSEQDRIIICISLNHLDIDNVGIQITRSNFDVRNYRIRKKLGEFLIKRGLNYGFVSILKLIDSGALRNCSVSDVCEKLKK